MKLGTSDALGRATTGELLKRQWSRLAALFGGFVAKWGDGNFQTYGSIAALPEMRRPDGRPYHVESIGRVARRLAEEGVIESKRVHPGQAIPSVAAKHRSSHGVTLKRFRWEAIEQKNPFNRRERRQQRQAQAALLRERGELVGAPAREYGRPRYSAAPASSPSSPPVSRATREPAARSEQASGRAAAPPAPMTRAETQAAIDAALAALERPPPD